MKKVFAVLLFAFLMVSVLSVSAQTVNWNNLSLDGYNEFIYSCGKSNGYKFQMGAPLAVQNVPEDKTDVVFYQLSDDDFVVFDFL